MFEYLRVDAQLNTLSVSRIDGGWESPRTRISGVLSVHVEKIESDVPFLLP